jgi:hypothetical protein
VKKLVVICPDEETKQAVFDTFGRLSSMMGLTRAFTEFIAKQDDTKSEAELSAAIVPSILRFVEGYQEIYPAPSLMKADMQTLDNVYDNLQFRKDG